MRRNIVLFLAVVLAAAVPARAKVTLPAVFSDNMVLQQGASAPVWGTAQPGARVKLTASWNGVTLATRADDNGRWRMDVATPAAGGPYRITVSDGEKLVLENVMIGEVWLCSGQSNMEMPFVGWGKPDCWEREIAEADHPSIRLLHVEHATAAQPQDDVKVRGGGWQVCSPASVPEFSATAYFFGRELAESLGVPVGLIHSSWGGTDIEPWIEGGCLRMIPEFVAKADEVQATEAGVKVSPHSCTALYNAMIAPIVPYGIRGAIWYQGENNVSRAWQYRDLFPLLIASWRQQWGTDFPFYFVQLTAFKPQLPEPGESEWAELREAQTRTLAVENTGMAVIIDKGSATDIHPKDKLTVGRRLALLARARTYGEEIPCSGPMYRSHRIAGNEIAIAFDCTDGGLRTSDGGAPTGFAVAGCDHRFHWAEARIEGGCVVVGSPQVPFPIAVRYGWADNPECNLCNGAGLPASPFRTDDWKGCTRKD